MSREGATLQTYNNELVTCIEELCAKREEIQQQISDEEKKRNNLQHDIQMLSNQLAELNESLSEKIAVREEYDKLIRETQDAYMKILKSSQALLGLVKTESSKLSQKNFTEKDAKDS
ncbi:Sjoegren syndrome nuclear autoantigen 1 homolog isoform X2 [Limulus polyphemus]|uniref:Sjoegren syndrome nuclear autoantigen 1 homolog isoform X2 n=1 Tax=Limulus polyphemus TaxID=6850 RepID=A0ABM1BN56_LIMPO|nr:Sjoegren syndrome nuclear autoantigen 1 homolog isoform X2 [Limulus polyphemus]